MSYEPKAGATLAGKYLLDRVLGEGGMGVVYAARHLRLDRPVAIKFLHAPMARDKTALARFLEEARAAGRLRHPNVIDVLDVDEEDGTPFMVLEMLQGEPLSTLLERRGALGWEETLTLLLPVLDAVGAAHALGVIHRDLKPDNIFLAQEGGHLVPKVLDFGIARQEDSQRSATATGAVMGTPVYMAPEQARGIRREIGPWTDVWSLGVIVFQCLAGRMHFDFDPEQGVMGWIVTVSTATPHRAREFVGHTPAHVPDAIDAALRVDHQARLQSVATLRAALLDQAPLDAVLPDAVLPVLASGDTQHMSQQAGHADIPQTVDSSANRAAPRGDGVHTGRGLALLGLALASALLVALSAWAVWMAWAAATQTGTGGGAIVDLETDAAVASAAASPARAAVGATSTDAGAGPTTPTLEREPTDQAAVDRTRPSSARTDTERRTPAPPREAEPRTETGARTTPRSGVETRTGAWRIDDMK